jgi:hypothetical protein
MAYFVFDLDLTLADIPMEVYNELRGIIRIPGNTNRYDAYSDYVNTKADQEVEIITNSAIHNGILRPNIISYMIQILTLKLQGLCKGIIIYSNNLDLINLEFIRDLLVVCIYKSTEDIPIDTIQSLFCLCIHRIYPGRPRNTNNPPKTWPELQTIMLNNKDACGITEDTVSPESIYFFDDMLPVHKIASQLPNGHYFQVVPYHKDGSTIDVIKNIIESDLQSLQFAIDVVRSKSLSGGRYKHTMKNRLKQKKQMRKHKYSKKNKRKNKVKKQN